METCSGKRDLEYIIVYLIKNNVKRIILSVGYKYKIIQDYFGGKFQDCEIIYSIEHKPLGTGGAIKKSIQLTRTNNFFVLNGDTFFNINLEKLWQAHHISDTMLTLSLKTLKNFDRYGNVKTDKNGYIQNFSEKKFVLMGKINAGFYVVNKDLFTDMELSENFSFEQFIETKVNYLLFKSLLFEDYFIDIGIPKDFQQAQIDFIDFIDLIL